MKMRGKRFPRVSTHVRMRGNRFPRIFAGLRMRGNLFPRISTHATTSFMPRRTRLEKLTRARERIAGMKSTFAPGEELWAGGTTSDLVKRMQAHIDAIDALSHAEAVRAEAVIAERAIERGLRELYTRLERWIRNKYGENPRLLARFGMSPSRTPGPKTVAAKKQMVEKAAATRTARGTKGKRRR
jgi:hypothetical protein